MEQQLRDILIKGNKCSAEELDKLLNKKSIYELTVNASRNSNSSISINRKYAKLYTANSIEYCLNPKYLENESKLKRVVYSIVKSAFKDYSRTRNENIEILLNYNYQADKVKKIKNELEETYSFIGTDAGFYEVPILEKALEFSIKNLSIKSINASLITEYI
jgi:hypothetical protein